MVSKESRKAYVAAALNYKGVQQKFHAIFDAMLGRAYFNDECCCMEIVVNTYVKKKIAEKAGLKSASAVNSCINACVQAGVLENVENGVYRFSPILFGDRNWNEVSEAHIVHLFKEEMKVSLELYYPSGQVHIADITQDGDGGEGDGGDKGTAEGAASGMDEEAAAP